MLLLLLAPVVAAMAADPPLVHRARPRGADDCTAAESPRAPLPGEANPPPAEPPSRRTLRHLPANFGRGVVGVFSRDSVGAAVLGGAITSVASIYDGDLRRTLAPSSGATVSTASGPVFSSLFVAGMFVGGRFSHGRFRAATYDMVAASLVNLTYTSLLKVTVRRERPDGSDNKSFPSGHTSNAFALAAVTERNYGWKVGVPAYLLAGVVGVARMQEDRHWLSDVVGGATLGYLVGRTVVRVNSTPPIPSKKTTAWIVSPRFTRYSRGLELSVVF